METMIPPKTNDGIFSKAGSFQLLEQASDQSIDVAYACIIPMPELPDLFLAQLAISRNVDVSLQFPPAPGRQLRRALGVCGMYG